VLVRKLLQFTSGAIYDGEGGYKVFDTSRTDLTLDLIEQREQCVVAFLWKHQRDLLTEGATKRGLRFGVIDGGVDVREREVIVARFQSGDLDVVFAHPQSAAHGLTLTRGTTTIWPSPTSNADWFQQFNRRIYRAGQTKRTETICISAAGTREKHVYERLDDKLLKMTELNSLLIGLTA
jgi:SNF2 family DNA or RNA helicase